MQWKWANPRSGADHPAHFFETRGADHIQRKSRLTAQQAYRSQRVCNMIALERNRWFSLQIGKGSVRAARTFGAGARRKPEELTLDHGVVERRVAIVHHSKAERSALLPHKPRDLCTAGCQCDALGDNLTAVLGGYRSVAR